MLGSIFGKKIGMTQIFTKDGKVVPVTAIDAGNWFVTQIKTQDKDGYSALQLGLLKKRYNQDSLAGNWLKIKKQLFSLFKEIKVKEEDLNNFKIGQKISLDKTVLSENDNVKVSGKSIGLGFQGVVKRWGFGGGPDSHGSNFHRIPGSVGNICSQGKVVKGKKLPGQTGNKNISIKNLKIIKLDKDSDVLFLKGSVPGKKESLVLINKQG
ncbi:50S ribosomal protein L3 [Candidatus Dependentiae bacterium]|nr:50S ribosomal protein L3 [Candidatus Dependentiae bacterium]